MNIITNYATLALSGTHWDDDDDDMRHWHIERLDLVSSFSFAEVFACMSQG